MKTAISKKKNNTGHRNLWRSNQLRTLVGAALAQRLVESLAERQVVLLLRALQELLDLPRARPGRLARALLLLRVVGRLLLHRLGGGPGGPPPGRLAGPVLLLGVVGRLLLHRLLLLLRRRLLAAAAACRVTHINHQ